MNLDVRHDDRFSVIAPAGRLNVLAAPQLRRAVDRLVDDGRANVVVDLGAVEFIDSSGLGALIGALKSARLAGGDLRIAAANEQVRTVLKLTNLDRVLRNHESPESAFDVE